MRDSMIFYRSFYEALAALDNDTKARVYDAVFEYGMNLKESELSGVAKTIFTLIKPQLDANIRKFDNGKRGGRPAMSETEKKPNHNLNETTTEPRNKQAESKGKTNVNENVNLNEGIVGAAPTLSDAQRLQKACQHTIAYLNQKAGKAFKPDNKETVRLIKARLNEGYTWNDFQKVIDGRIALWTTDPEMMGYIRPATLFGNKFESYLNTDVQAIKAAKMKEQSGTEPVKYTPNFGITTR